MFETIRNAWKIPDLRKKILYTLMMLAIVRIGSTMPSPFIDATVMNEYFSTSGGVMALFDAMSGGAFSNMNLFAMGITPYINASIIMNLLTIAIPRLEELNKDGEAGRKKIAQYTRYVTVVLALVQAFGISYSLNNAYGVMSTEINTVWAIIVSVLTFTAGTAFVMWIGENITAKGVGNGTSLIIMVNILSSVPTAITALTNYEHKWALIILAVLALIIVAFTVLLSLGERRIPVQYAKKMQGRKTYGGQSTNIPIKVNLAGVIPIIFAVSLISFPQIITSFFTANPTGWWGGVISWLNTSHPFGAVLYVVLIILFTYFYASISFNPLEIANNMKKNGGFIPGIRPGKPTYEYIQKSSKYIIFMGAIGLAILASIPVIMSFIFKIDNLNIGGSSLLIVVGVALETVKQVEGMMVTRHYKGFLRE
jgi:preprotein translocase subunit SecY